jgi:RNA polymerase sigma-70 factor, ECF subfamily
VLGRARVGALAMHDHMPDDVTLARTAMRNPEAFLALYDRYLPSIERYIAARTGQSDVEDLVSATFTRALSRIGSFRSDRGTFAAWLFTIARNMVVDHYRRTDRRGEMNVGHEPVEGQPGPEAAAIANEESRRVHDALAGLTAEQRDALALRYAADLPFAAVGATLGKSEPAAKMLVQRGLQTLRRHLQEDLS